MDVDCTLTQNLSGQFSGVKYLLSDRSPSWFWRGNQNDDNSKPALNSWLMDAAFRRGEREGGTTNLVEPSDARSHCPLPPPPPPTPSPSPPCVCQAWSPSTLWSSVVDVIAVLSSPQSFLNNHGGHLWTVWTAWSVNVTPRLIIEGKCYYSGETFGGNPLG